MYTFILINIILIELRMIIFFLIFAEDDACTDISIIGGGLAGSYLSWKLENSSKKVHLYEMSDRLGGRLLDNDLLPYINETIPLFNYFVNPEKDTILMNLFEKLNLNLTKLSERKVYYFLRNHLKTEKDRNDSNLPYFLDEHEKGLSPENLQK